MGSIKKNYFNTQRMTQQRAKLQCKFKTDSTAVLNLEELMEKVITNLSKTDEIVIGNNKYIVSTHYKKDARETAEQKLLRYVTNCIANDLKVGTESTSS